MPSERESHDTISPCGSPSPDDGMSYGRLPEDSSDGLASDEEGRSAIAPSNNVGFPPNTSRRLVIIEPVLALYFVAWLPGMILQTQFIFDQMARKNNLSAYENKFNTSGESSCGGVLHNTTFFYVQQKSQEEAAQFSIYLDSTSAIVQLLAVVVYGALSDKLGRRLPLILPLIGGALKYLLVVLVIVFDLPLPLLLLGYGLEGVLGGASTILMASFAYIADITTQKNRTLRITIAEIACGLSSSVAQVAIGFIIKDLGYLYPYFILMGFHVGNCLYVIFFVPETRKAPEPFKIRSVLAVHKHLKATVRVYTTDDGSGRRGRMLTCLPALFLFGLVLTGRLGPQTLYLLNSPFCWSSVQLGVYMAIFGICANIGQIVSYALFYKKLGDTGITIKGAISCCVSLILLAFASKSWMVYLVPVIGYGSMLPIPILRSVMSKMTSPNEQGALFASVSGVETITALVSSLIFNPIYEKTLYLMPGFVFLVMSGLEVFGILFVIGYIFLQYKHSRSAVGHSRLSHDDSDEHNIGV